MRTILIFSGGLDSTCLLYHLLKNSHEVKCLSFNYGQRHSIELQQAQKIASFAGVEHKICDLLSVWPLLQGSSQTDPRIPVPEGHYAAENMKLTVVPNRNMIMLSIAIGWAVSLKADQVAFGAHTGDHTIYPDCRENFVVAMNSVAQLCDWHPVTIVAPFINLDKAGCVKAGDKADAPFHLTYSCYKGETAHCGKCGACTERKEAFKTAGVPDPTIYSN